MVTKQWKKFKKAIRNRSIRTKFSIAVFALVFLCVVFQGMFFYLNTSGILVESYHAQLEESLHHQTEYMAYRLENIATQFNFLDIDDEFRRIRNLDNVEIDDFVVASNLLADMRNQNREIVRNISYYRGDGLVFHEFNEGYHDEAANEWYRQALSNTNFLTWYNEPPHENVFLLRETSRQRIHGILLFELRRDFFNNELKNFSAADVFSLYILDQNKEIVAQAHRGTEPLPFGQMSSLNDSNGTKRAVTTYNGQNLLTVKDEIRLNNWSLILIVPEYAITGRLRGTWLITIYTLLAGLLIFIGLGYLIARLITKPVTSMTGLLRSFRGGDFSVRFNPDSEDEIGKLGSAFNDMADNIEYLIHEVREERELKIQSEYKTLQEQINSHFLYNTLDSIYWTIKDGNEDNAAQMCCALANYFRLLFNQGDDITTVRNEVEYARNYLLIEKMRYGDKFDYHFEVDSRLEDVRVPKILLQPFVENSIIHGFYNSGEKGTMYIRVYRKDSKMILEVEDNGIGMDVQSVLEHIELNMMKKITKKDHGFALINIATRLELIYKGAASISLESASGCRTIARVIIPLEEE